MAQSLCFLPLADSLLSPFFVPFTYLETLLAVTGSVHLGLRLLVNWPHLSQSFPTTSPLQVPSTQVKYWPHYDDFKNLASPVPNRHSTQRPWVLLPVWSSPTKHSSLSLWLYSEWNPRAHTFIRIREFILFVLDPPTLTFLLRIHGPILTVWSTHGL
jgi:hypothetical protein